MDNKTMNIDKKILEELSRFNSINKYINEQELPPPPAEDPLAGAPADPLAGAPADPLAGAPPVDPAAAGATPPPAPGTEPAPVDVEADPDVEKVGDESGKEELDITDLVKSQKNVEEKQEEYFQQLFSHLENLESKLGEMDNIVNQLNSLEAKVDKYREKTPQEKLELRSLDSGPYNQKLSDFFIDKQEDMEKSGKNEYILTTDEVKDFSPNEIQKTFRDFDDEEGYKNNF
jgi:hypothetical protein